MNDREPEQAGRRDSCGDLISRSRDRNALSEIKFRPKMETPFPSEPPKVAPWDRRLRLLRWHVIAFAFFLPFVFLLAIHRHLGLSDAMMVAPAPGQTHSILYNMVMIRAFWFGVCGYILHVVLIAERSPRWVIGKLSLLAVMWAALIWAWR
jgi:hypothetical protein